MSYNDIDPTDWTYYNPDYHDDYESDDVKVNSYNKAIKPEKNV